MLAGILLISKGFNYYSAQNFKALFIAGYILGNMKYFFVLRRSTKSLISHIRELQLPIKLWQAYPLKVFIFMVFMPLLGYLMKYIPLGMQERAVIDFTIGIALINGATDFLREAIFAKKKIFKA